MVNIRFHLPKPHWTPYDNYTKYFFILGVSALTIVIRVRVDFHRRVIVIGGIPCGLVVQTDDEFRSYCTSGFEVRLCH